MGLWESNSRWDDIILVLNTLKKPILNLSTY
jgi:hypothetical protein